MRLRRKDGTEFELGALSVREFRTLISEMPDVADRVQTAAKERMRTDADDAG